MAPFRVSPEKQWWGEISHLGKVLGSDLVIHLLQKEMQPKGRIYVDLWVVMNDGTVCSGTLREKIWKDLECEIFSTV